MHGRHGAIRKGCLAFSLSSIPSRSRASCIGISSSRSCRLTCRQSVVLPGPSLGYEHVSEIDERVASPHPYTCPPSQGDEEFSYMGQSGGPLDEDLRHCV
eukprot:509256-Pyramimonas_sp.AAC.1